MHKTGFFSPYLSPPSLPVSVSVRSFYLSAPPSESEAFEAFSPARIDELLKEARALEQSLEQQKDRLRERLAAVSRALDLL